MFATLLSVHPTVRDAITTASSQAMLYPARRLTCRSEVREGSCVVLATNAHCVEHELDD